METVQGLGTSPWEAYAAPKNEQPNNEQFTPIVKNQSTTVEKITKFIHNLLQIISLGYWKPSVSEPSTDNNLVIEEIDFDGEFEEAGETTPLLGGRDSAEAVVSELDDLFNKGEDHA